MWKWNKNGCGPRNIFLPSGSRDSPTAMSARRARVVRMGGWVVIKRVLRCCSFWSMWTSKMCSFGKSFQSLSTTYFWVWKFDSKLGVGVHSFRIYPKLVNFRIFCSKLELFWGAEIFFFNSKKLFTSFYAVTPENKIVYLNAKNG